MIPAGILAAFLEYGGCIHTPFPWKGCDTCGRVSAEWTKQIGLQVVDTAWQAETIDGTKYEKQEILSLDNLPQDEKDKISKLHIATDNPFIPMLHALVDPRKGQRVRMFKKHFIKMGVNNVNNSNKLSLFVIEILFDPKDEKNFIRLYLHPQLGPIISTEDLYF